ncbi:MAG: class I SAM-dependent methyltransferase [Candidatus Lernaella stagnicola]|nr:class I SAM-dependent methyltransferase [Candidatus Lernaella stagnicola]
MSYEAQLRETFGELDLGVEDLFLLDDFQIGYLPERAPRRELAVTLHANPALRRYFVSKWPPIATYLATILRLFQPVDDRKTLISCADRLVWEIAEMIVYNKHPDFFARSTGRVDLAEITKITPLAGKVVIDAGAGPGTLAFPAAAEAKLVMAVEPASGMRRYLREQICERNVLNIQAIDGFLHAIPLPADFADVLLTCRAIGWNLEAELVEIERVLRPGGFAVHLSGYQQDEANPVHETLVAAPWNYHVETYVENGITKRKYWKQLS